MYITSFRMSQLKKFSARKGLAICVLVLFLELQTRQLGFIGTNAVEIQSLFNNISPYTQSGTQSYFRPGNQETNSFVATADSLAKQIDGDSKCGSILCLLRFGLWSSRTSKRALKDTQQSLNQDKLGPVQSTDRMLYTSHPSSTHLKQPNSWSSYQNLRHAAEQFEAKPHPISNLPFDARQRTIQTQTVQVGEKLPPNNISKPSGAQINVWSHQTSGISTNPANKQEQEKQQQKFETSKFKMIPVIVISDSNETTSNVTPDFGQLFKHEDSTTDSSSVKVNNQTHSINIHSTIQDAIKFMRNPTFPISNDSIENSIINENSLNVNSEVSTESIVSEETSGPILNQSPEFEPKIMRFEQFHYTELGNDENERPLRSQIASSSSLSNANNRELAKLQNLNSLTSSSDQDHSMETVKQQLVEGSTKLHTDSDELIAMADGEGFSGSKNSDNIISRPQLLPSNQNLMIVNHQQHLTTPALSYYPNIQHHNNLVSNVAGAHSIKPPFQSHTNQQSNLIQSQPSPRPFGGRNIASHLMNKAKNQLMKPILYPISHIQDKVVKYLHENKRPLAVKKSVLQSLRNEWRPRPSVPSRNQKHEQQLSGLMSHKHSQRQQQHRQQMLETYVNPAFGGHLPAANQPPSANLPPINANSNTRSPKAFRFSPLFFRHSQSYSKSLFLKSVLNQYGQKQTRPQKQIHQVSNVGQQTGYGNSWRPDKATEAHFNGGQSTDPEPKHLGSQSGSSLLNADNNKINFHHHQDKQFLPAYSPKSHPLNQIAHQFRQRESLNNNHYSRYYNRQQHQQQSSSKSREHLNRQNGPADIQQHHHIYFSQHQQPQIEELNPFAISAQNIDFSFDDSYEQSAYNANITRGTISNLTPHEGQQSSNSGLFVVEAPRLKLVDSKANHDEKFDEQQLNKIPVGDFDHTGAPRGFATFSKEQVRSIVNSSLAFSDEDSQKFDETGRIPELGASETTTSEPNTKENISDARVAFTRMVGASIEVIGRPLKVGQVLNDSIGKIEGLREYQTIGLQPNLVAAEELKIPTFSEDTKFAYENENGSESKNGSESQNVFLASSQPVEMQHLAHISEYTSVKNNSPQLAQPTVQNQPYVPDNVSDKLLAQQQQTTAWSAQINHGPQVDMLKLAVPFTNSYPSPENVALIDHQVYGQRVPGNLLKPNQPMINLLNFSQMSNLTIGGELSANQRDSLSLRLRQVSSEPKEILMSEQPAVENNVQVQANSIAPKFEFLLADSPNNQTYGNEQRNNESMNSISELDYHSIRPNNTSNNLDALGKLDLDLVDNTVIKVGSMKETRDSLSSFCNGKAPGLYPDEEQSCQFYYRCAPAEHVMFSCNTNKRFNIATNSCDWWYSVDCKGQLDGTTTAATKQLEETTKSNQITTQSDNLLMRQNNSSGQMFELQMVGEQQSLNSTTSFSHQKQSLEFTTEPQQQPELKLNLKSTKSIESLAGSAEYSFLSSLEPTSSTQGSTSDESLATTIGASHLTNDSQSTVGPKVGTELESNSTTTIGKQGVDPFNLSTASQEDDLDLINHSNRFEGVLKKPHEEKLKSSTILETNVENGREYSTETSTIRDLFERPAVFLPSTQSSQEEQPTLTDSLGRSRFESTRAYGSSTQRPDKQEVADREIHVLQDYDSNKQLENKLSFQNYNQRRSRISTTRALNVSVDSIDTTTIQSDYNSTSASQLFADSNLNATVRHSPKSFPKLTQELVSVNSSSVRRYGQRLISKNIRTNN